MPNLVLYNANIHTLDSARPYARALAIQGNRVVRVGSDADVVQAAPPDARKIDLNGLTILPGLTDAHGHLRNLGRVQEMVLLYDALPGGYGRASQRTRRADA